MKTLTEYIANNRQIQKVGHELASDFGDRYPNSRAIYYNVNTSGELFKVFAFVTYPKTKKPKNGYPAILLLHGGDGMAYIEFTKKYADMGYVVIAPDYNAKCALSLKQRDVDNPHGGPKGYGSHNDLHSNHPWAYFSVLSSMCAIDFLCALPFVDKKNIFSIGLSWGGFLNLLLLSQDNRIKAGSIIYSSAFTHESEWGKSLLKDMNESDRQQYISYIEPSNYLNRIDCPVLFTAGTDDLAFKMVNRMKTSNCIKGKSFFALRRIFPHSNFWGFEQVESIEFFNKIKSKLSVPQPNVKLLNDKKIRVVSGVKNSKLHLVYTFDDVVKTEIQKWTKRKINANEKIQINDKCTAFFITMQIGELQWSSNLFVL